MVKCKIHLDNYATSRPPIDCSSFTKALKLIGLSEVDGCGEGLCQTGGKLLDRGEKVPQRPELLAVVEEVAPHGVAGADRAAVPELKSGRESLPKSNPKQGHAT